MSRGVVALALSLTVTGCTHLVPFTDDLRKQYRIDDDRATKLQFFLDGDLVLEREISGEAVEVKHGKIVSRAGLLLNRVAVEHLTAGVALVASMESVLHVSFDAGSSSTLAFRRVRCEDRQIYCFDADGQGPPSEVRYDGESYRVVTNKPQKAPDGNSYAARSCFLLVDLDQLAKVEEQRRTLPGRRLE